jgi:parallel beta-helix repeat protein
MSRASTGRVAVVVSLAAALALAGTAQAAILQVRANKPDALQKAINRADPGDKLEVHGGRYRETVVVTKRLRIVGVSKRRPVVDGTCDTPTTIDVVRRGVTLRHLKVKGAEQDGGPGYTVSFSAVATGTIRDTVLEQSCALSPEYGINVFGSGPIKIIDNHAYGGFEDAGIYVGTITDTLGKTLLIKGNESNGNNRGLIVEDSFGEDVDIVVRENSFHDNAAEGVTDDQGGMFLFNVSGGRYIDNRFNDNAAFGIDIAASSSNNVFTDNVATGNGDEDLHDLGTGNCGSGNSFSIDPC